VGDNKVEVDGGHAIYVCQALAGVERAGVRS
jgi:hypothetical protein